MGSAVAHQVSHQNLIFQKYSQSKVEVFSSSGILMLKPKCMSLLRSTSRPGKRGCPIQKTAQNLDYAVIRNFSSISLVAGDIFDASSELLSVRK
jgi:hypothetical protein